MAIEFAFADAPVTSTEIIIPPVAPVAVQGPTHLYQGFSTFSGQGLSTVAVGGAQSPVPVPNTSNSYRICTSFDDLSTFFSVDASLSTDEFVLSKADATSKFLSSLNITSQSVVIAFSYFSTSTYSADQFNVPADLIPTTAADMQQFLLQNGDMFVQSIAKGAGYVGCYVFYAQSVSEQQSVSTQLTANDVSEEGEISAKVNAIWQTAIQSISTRSSFVGQSFGVSGGTPAALADVAGFLTQVDAASSLPGAAVLSYVGLPYEKAGLEAAINSFAPDVVTNRATYPTLAAYADQIEVVATQINAVQRAQMAFGYTADQQLNHRIGQITQDQSLVLGWIQSMAQSPWLEPASTITQPVSLSWGMPILSFKLIPGPSWGNHAGTGGDRVTYFDPGLIYGGHNLTSVTVNGGGEVNYLLLDYAGLDTLHLGAPDGGGSGPQTLNLAPDETIANVSCEAGNYVNRLIIQTSLGQTLDWPNHANSAASYGPWPAPNSLPPNTVFAGFGGSYDSKDKQHLWTITPVAVEMLPAAWLPIPPSSATPSKS